MSIELYVPFLAHQLGCTPDEVKPSRGPAMELAELLYPFAQLFAGEEGRPVRERVYCVDCEPEVDRFLEELEANPKADNGIESVDGAHVFYERVRQALIVCGANAAAKQSMLLPPRSLPEGLRQVAAALLMLHRMRLPYKPGTASPS